MRELRCIVFNEKEVVTAVIDHRHSKRKPLPVGMVRGIAINTDGRNTCSLKLEDYDGKRNAVSITEAELAAALIEYCLSRRIPMPRKSDKEINVVGGDIMMVMTISNFDLVRTPPTRMA